MAVPTIDGIPISSFCQYALEMERDTWRFVVGVSVLIIAVVWYFAGIFSAAIALVVISVLGNLVHSQFKKSEQSWLEIDKNDREVSSNVEDILRTFHAYSDEEIYSAGVAESQFGSLWHAQYAQYFSGERSLLGDVLGMTVSDGILRPTGSFSGKVTGSIGPDSLSDMGAVIILQSEEGKVLRVVVPQRQIAEKMFAEALLSFIKDEKTLNTHTSLHIVRLAVHLPKKACSTFASAVGILDRIVASCGQNLGEQSLVKVYGQEVSHGVILATALEIDGERGVFIPTGYFKEVTDKLSELLGTYRGDVRMLLNGEGPFAPKEAQPTV